MYTIVTYRSSVTLKIIPNHALCFYNFLKGRRTHVKLQPNL